MPHGAPTCRARRAGTRPMLAGGHHPDLRPAGPGARPGATAGATTPGRTAVRRPAVEGQEGHAFMRRA